MAKSRLPTTSKKPIPVKIVSDTVCDRPMEMDKYRIHDALRTIKEAEKFRADKSLMKAVKAEAKKEAKALSKI